MTSPTRVTLASGIELATTDKGPRDAPALIFLHGFPESHRTWRFQIEHLADRFRCIAPDQRGYGGSSKPQEVAAYTPDQLIADVFQLADALGIGRFTVLGHDWGGVVAWGVAMIGQTSGRVSGAVIANAPHPALFQRLLYLDPQQRAASQYIRAFRDPANDELVRQRGLAALIARSVHWQRRPPIIETVKTAAHLAGWQDPAEAFGMLNWYRASPVEVPPRDAPLALPDGWQPPPLPRITIPTLVIWALEDEALPASNLAGLEDLVAQLTIVRVSDCGHFVPWEAPTHVNAALDRFLAPRDAG